MYLKQTEEIETGRPMFGKRRLSIAIAIAAAIVLGSNAAGILTQTLPEVGAEVASIINQTLPHVGTSPIISACLSPKNLTAYPGTVAAGSAGHIRFECGIEEAFHADSGAVASPAFNLTAGYTELWIFLHSGATPGNCSAGDSALQLVSGTNITFASAGDYDYCAEYMDAPATGLESFTITWTTVP